MNTAEKLSMASLPSLLAPFAGGFFAGLIRIAGGAHALIVSPKDEGEFEGMEWGEFGQDVAGAVSFFDGLANTEAMAEAGSAVAKRVRALRIGGHNDWHIPARDELELLYRCCKPTADENYPRCGDNPSSIPVGYPYRDNTPPQCTDPLFQIGGAEAFARAWYWSSTQCSAHVAWLQDFVDGDQFCNSKDLKDRVRAVRTIPVSH